MPRASTNRAPDDRRSDERTRPLFAKNDDDVGDYCARCASGKTKTVGK
jgi:hypothetical protein